MYFNRTERVFLQILLLIVFISIISECKGLTFKPAKETTIRIINSKNMDCKMCKNPAKSPQQQCKDSITFDKNIKVEIEIKCKKSQDLPTLEIKRNIACSQTSCDTVSQVYKEFSGLEKYPRRFTWNISSSSTNSLSISFEGGLQQIGMEKTCPDKHTFTLQDKGATLEKYCSKGPNTVPVRKNQSFSLELPAGQRLNHFSFEVSLQKKSESKPLVIPILCALVGLLIIFIILLLMVYIRLKKNNREAIPEVSVYNSGNNHVQPAPNRLPVGSEGDEHLYSMIDESLIYSHLLRRQGNGFYDEYETFQSVATDCRRPTIHVKAGDEGTVSIFQNQQGHPPPNRPPSYLELLGDRPPTPGPHLKPKEAE